MTYQSLLKRAKISRLRPSVPPEEKLQLVRDITEARRDLSRDRVRKLITKKERSKEVSYSKYTPQQMLEILKKSGRGTIVVSCHTHAYYLLLGHLDFSPVPVSCIVKDPMVDEMIDNGFPLSEKAEIVSTLRSRDLAELVSGERVLFVMADVLSPNTVSRCVEIGGRVIRYSTSWAKLAARYKLNVVSLFYDDRQKNPSISIDLVEYNEAHQGVIACEFFDKLDAFLGNETEFWEKEAHFLFQSFPLPQLNGDLNANAMKMLHGIAKCDIDLSRVTLSLLTQHKNV